METRRTAVTCIVKIEEFTTGRVLTPDDITVSAENGWLHPAFQPDGYYVFTQRLPPMVQIEAQAHCEVQLPIDEADRQRVKTLALLPRHAGAQDTVHRVQLLPQEIAWLGYRTLQAGYYLRETLHTGEATLRLAKEDYADLQFCRLLLRDRTSGQMETVLVHAHQGYGVYTLAQGALQTHDIGACEVFPLKRVIASAQGSLDVPRIAHSTGLFVCRADGSISVATWEGA